MSSEIRITKRRAFSAVPDDILTNKTLSAESRLALAYLVGRPDGWTIYVSQVQSALGFSEARWARVRKELVEAGYFSQERLQNDAGRWVWQNTVTDTPTIPTSGETIPPKSRDGFPTDGKPIHGEQGDKTKNPHHEDLSIGHHHHPKEVDEPQSAAGEVVVEFPQNLKPETHRALLAQLRKVAPRDQQAILDDLAGWMSLQAAAGKPVTNPAGVFRKMVERYVAGGWVPESAHIGSALRERHHQSQIPPPVATKPKIDPEAQAAGAALLAAARARRKGENNATK